MVRKLQTFCLLMLISIGILSVMCVVQQLQAAPEIRHNPRLTIIEKFKEAGYLREENNQNTTSPLIRQAEAFALYLNPPEPPKSREATETKERQTQTVSAPKPKFRVIGIIYNRSKPEKSMALISEPGKEPHWVKQGARLGRFIIEKVERRMIIYRSGGHSREMAVDIKSADQIAYIRRSTLLSSQTEILQEGSAGPNEPEINKP